MNEPPKMSDRQKRSDDLENMATLKAIFKPEPDPARPRCERCRRHVDGVGVHDYWPAYSLCARCVGVLLDIHWAPFVLRPGTEDDYYVCADEKEWHDIKAGRKAIPEPA